MRTLQTNAGPSRLQAVRPRTNQRRQSTPARLVVPQLEEIAARITDLSLSTIRHQVQPGERVAVYDGFQKDDHAPGRISLKPNNPGYFAGSRFYIVGPQRQHQTAPLNMMDGTIFWVLVGLVEITEDGERSLPVPVQ